MSELNEVMNVMQVSGERMPSGYYKKCEVDAVLAEKDAEIAKLDDCIRDYSEKTKTLVIANLDMQRMEYHHKYKRCLAMVKYCHESAMWLEECGVTKSATFMLRWQNRWQEIAEKFKEVK